MQENRKDIKSRKGPAAAGILDKLSIRSKIVIIIMLVSSLALLLSGCAFITYKWFSFRQLMVNDLATQARIVADNSVGALSFDDPKDAEEVLESLSSKAAIEYAYLYRNDGSVIAAYRRDKTGADTGPPVPEAAVHRFHSDRLVMFRPVIFNNRPIGTIYLQSDLRELYASIRQSAYILSITILIAFIAAFGLSVKLQQLISGPVLSLAETAGEVSRKRDYSIRAAKHAEDEVGYLIDSFNEMLAQIQQQDHALSENEEKFRSLVETTNDLIWEVDKNGVYTYVSPMVHDILGYTPEEVVGRTPFEHMPAEEAGRISKIFKSISASREAFTGLENVNIHKDGHDVIIETSGVPFFSAEGTFHGYRGIDRDITERKQVEDELRKYRAHLEELVQMRTDELERINASLLDEVSERQRAEEETKRNSARLEEANKELSSFSYSISHDLRAPLRAVNGFTNVLLEDHSGQLDDEGKRVLNIIKSNTERMGELISDILRFSRLGQQEIAVSTIDMKSLATAVVNDMKTETADRKIQFRIGIMPESMGDAAMIKQVFVNILSNAVKFTRLRETSVIEIGGNEKNDENIYYIKDNGVGFDMQYVNKIFSVFQRLHGTEEFEGTGVGLSLVQRIIHRHGGRVWAEGKADRGAAFYFSLPQKLENDKKA